MFANGLIAQMYGNVDHLKATLVQAQQNGQTNHKNVFGDSGRQFKAAFDIYLEGDGKQPQDGKDDALKILMSVADRTPQLIEERKSEYVHVSGQLDKQIDRQIQTCQKQTGIITEDIQILDENKGAQTKFFLLGNEDNTFLSDQK